ncbi:MAG: virulence protein RhuM/Fic/DOC family protein, partial [Candidatus Taylorbacteria bacterium]|nr:virulence protein RhuM/Fic/DOC family protein [Candidatus Taylorbacteria bacterium]
FKVSIPTINEHLKHIFKSKELDKDSVIRNFLITAEDGKRYNTNHYNLDCIISLGYKVNSKIATNFRIWATNVLRKHIVDGYTINETRLLEARNKLKDLQEAVSFIQDSSRKELLSDKTKDILNILSDYSKALSLLDEYDRESFKEIKGTKSRFKLTYNDCFRVIESVSEKFVEDGEKEIFALEKDNSFKSAIDNLYQTYNGKDLYETTEEKAANLLYLVVKDHSFVGGNKRIASIIFAYYIEKTGLSYNKNGERKINDSGLVALTLLIAGSNPKDKDILVKMIKNLLV